jgi:hypothetical protein
VDYRNGFSRVILLKSENRSYGRNSYGRNFFRVFSDTIFRVFSDVMRLMREDFRVFSNAITTDMRA